MDSNSVAMSAGESIVIGFMLCAFSGFVVGALILAAIWRIHG